MNLSAVPQPRDDDILVDTLIEASGVLACLLVRALEARSGEVTPGQYEALLVLEKYGPTCPTELTESLGIDASTTTRLCDRLLQRGLIRRERPEHNRREVQIALSPSGQMLIDEIAADRRMRFASVIDAIPRSRQTALFNALDLLIGKARVPDQIIAD